jgi:hypothetical protein
MGLSLERSAVWFGSGDEAAVQAAGMSRDDSAAARALTISLNRADYHESTT